MKIFIILMILINVSFGCFVDMTPERELSYTIDDLIITSFLWISMFLFFISFFKKNKKEDYKLFDKVFSQNNIRCFAFILFILYCSLYVSLTFMRMSDIHGLFYYIEKHEGLLNLIKYLFQ